MRVPIPMLLCAIGFAACSSGPHAAYERGTLTRPPPPELRPGVGLPRPHMPGQNVVPQVEPNPRPKRLLPPQRGPGIWAGDEPRASVAPTLDIDGVRIPLPSTGEDSVRAGLCADVVGQALSENKGGLINMRGAERDMKTCLVFMAWRHCMGSSVWKDGEADTATKWIAYADALMLEKKASAQCWRWKDAFDNNVRDPFDWYLKSWYFRTHKPRTP